MPAKPPKPGKPPKPPPNPDPSALGAAAAPAAPAAAAADCAAELMPVLIRGPITDPSMVDAIDKPAHPGIAAYSVITPLKMPPSDKPDVDKSPPAGPKIVDEVEDELPLNKEDKGDARFCSAV